MNGALEYVENSPSELATHTIVFNLTFEKMDDDKENLLYN
jgi:hypothetical protein